MTRRLKQGVRFEALHLISRKDGWLELHRHDNGLNQGDERMMCRCHINGEVLFEHNIHDEVLDEEEGSTP